MKNWKVLISLSDVIRFLKSRIRRTETVNNFVDGVVKEISNCSKEIHLLINSEENTNEILRDCYFTTIRSLKEIDKLINLLYFIDNTLSNIRSLLKDNVKCNEIIDNTNKMILTMINDYKESGGEEITSNVVFELSPEATPFKCQSYRWLFIDRNNIISDEFEKLLDNEKWQYVSKGIWLSPDGPLSPELFKLISYCDKRYIHGSYRYNTFSENNFLLFQCIGFYEKKFGKDNYMITREETDEF